MFQIKDFVSIAASILNYARATQTKITDFSVGSVARTLLEAPAVEMEELYQQMWLGLNEAIPVAIYQSFDFARQPAKSSAGTIRIQIASAAVERVVPAGTIFTSSAYGVAFQSSVDVPIPASASFVDVAVVAVTPGAVGNVAAGTQFSLRPEISGVTSATAIADFTVGSDEETDEQRKVRFAGFIRSLARSTRDALLYGLGLVAVQNGAGSVIERVRFAKIVEPWLTDPLAPTALVLIYIHSGGNGVASGALVQQAQKEIDGYYLEDGTPVPGWKAAGIKVEVTAAPTVAIDVTAALTVAAGYLNDDVTAAVEAVIGDYIAGIDIGKKVIRAELIAAAMNVDGVVNIDLPVPAADVTPAANAKPVIGTLTVTVA